MSILKPALIFTSAFMLLSFGPARVFSPALSPSDMQTIAEIQALSASIRADCKSMTLDDFHLEMEPAYLRDISRKLAVKCMSGQ
uniref:Putative secreted protein n=2 Tax=Erwinia amylovora TaxID=552 RepID=A0A0P0ZGS7_ERWAM|nr:putative secreted protein [Erwinia amylovora]